MNTERKTTKHVSFFFLKVVAFERCNFSFALVPYESGEKAGEHYFCLEYDSYPINAHFEVCDRLQYKCEQF